MSQHLLNPKMETKIVQNQVQQQTLNHKKTPNLCNSEKKEKTRTAQALNASENENENQNQILVKNFTLTLI